MHEPRAAAGGDAPIRGPGSMTSVMRAARGPSVGPRCLRYALLIDGRIVEERTVGPESTVTIGDAHTADVHHSAIRGQRVLFIYRGDAWMLRYAEGWRGRLATGSLEGRSDPVEDDGFRGCPLLEDARARLDLGSMSLLVQLVDRPPTRSRPRLPPRMVGGIVERADRWFTSFVCASLIAHFTLVAFLMEADWPVDPAPFPEYAARLIFEEPEVPEPLENARELESADNSRAESETDDDGPPENGPPDSPSRPVHRPPEGDPTLADAEAREAMAAVQLALGALLADADHGAVDDLLRRGASADNAASVMESVDGVTLASAEDLGRLDERVGVDPDGSRDALAALARERAGHGTRSQAVDEGGPVTELLIVRPPSPDEVEPIGGALFDPAELIARLRDRMGRVRACYEREITRGAPTAEGRLTLSVTVMPVGSLSAVHLADNTTGSEMLGQCAINAVRTVRVRVGPSSPVEVRYPLVFARQE